MKFTKPLIPATLIKRYKRFLADVRLENGDIITVHTPNTGAMLGCADPGSRIWLRDTQNPKRKYRYSWEMSQTANGVKVGVHTGLANHLVKEGIENGIIKELQGYSAIQTEVRYGKENSRIDLLLEAQDGMQCFVEVKNVTAVQDSTTAIFPDAVSARGTKHLRELMLMASRGQRAVIFYCIQRSDVAQMCPADTIDPLYATTLREALANGVEALAYRAEVSPEEVSLCTPVPVRESGSLQA